MGDLGEGSEMTAADVVPEIVLGRLQWADGKRDTVYSLGCYADVSASRA